MQKRKLTVEQYLNQLKELRKDNAQVYDYSKVSFKNLQNDKIIIGCEKHGDFLQRRADHRAGSGCPKCGKIYAKITCLEKYGVDNPSKSEIIKKKMQTKFLSNYGVDNPSKSEIIKKKKEETYKKNFGTTHYWRTNESKIKKKETNKERYGTEYPMQNLEIKTKMMETKISRGSFSKPNSSKEATEFIKRYIKDRGYLIDQCAYTDYELELHEWGLKFENTWILFDLVVFEKGYRGDKNKILEILEYHGPFHYTLEDVKKQGSNKAYPWKTNQTTIEESYIKDQQKRKLAKSLTDNYTIIWSKDL